MYARGRDISTEVTLKTVCEAEEEKDSTLLEQCIFEIPTHVSPLLQPTARCCARPSNSRY